MKLPVSKTWLVKLGTAIGLAGVVFVGFKLYAYSHQIDANRLALSSYAVLAVLAIVYGSANTLLGVAWLNILHHLGLPASSRWSLWAYATSQLAKYVPGNIFQFAGRQVIGVGAGFANAPLGKSILYELALLCLAACHFVTLGAPLLLPGLGLTAPTAVFLVVVWASFALLDWFLGRSCAKAFLLYVAFLFVSGAVFALVASYSGVASTGLQAFLPVVSAFVVAWMIGLVTPGIPAGLGVREAVLIVLLPAFGDEPSIVTAVLLGRIVTVLGDTLFYASGYFIKPSQTAK
ncbi:hypothetical protein FP2506_02035 [Fulvimarina pelagi HTCC2506]|uniref:Transmembrane protein n=1 Tax=Fulvimarina pelagi HTCC2506 TaxID=314231 RepID=Q0FYL3_9HYPH|nr:hypothetical protein FP2506_02035 [Fulvimarina pelagi HTCC2506]